MSDHKEKTVKKQMTEVEKIEAEKVETEKAEAIYDQIPDTYEEWEDQRKDVRMEFAKQYQKRNSYTLSLLAGLILFFNAFQQMQKIRLVGMEEAGTETIIILVVSLVAAIGLFLYASHLRKLRYKEYREYMERMQGMESGEDEKE